MKEIPLSQGKVAFVDDNDFEYLNQFKWWAHHNGSFWYAGSHMNNYRKGFLMHRIILQTPKGMETDHVNGDGLDNRRSNLRVCTKSENMHNMGLGTRKKTSRFKGVHWHEKRQRWIPEITCNRKHKVLGYYKDEIEAAKVYDDAARKYFGEFARLNFA